MEYVTITKAAKLLGISRPTLYKWIAEGKLRVRRSILDTPGIPVRDIERHLSNGQRRPAKG